MRKLRLWLIKKLIGKSSVICNFDLDRGMLRARAHENVVVSNMTLDMRDRLFTEDPYEWFIPQAPAPCGIKVEGPPVNLR